MNAENVGPDETVGARLRKAIFESLPVDDPMAWSYYTGVQSVIQNLPTLPFLNLGSSSTRSRTLHYQQMET